MNNLERGGWGIEPEPGPVVSRPWYRKKRWLIPIGLVFVAGVIGQFSDDPPETVAVRSAAGIATTAVTEVAVVTSEPAVEPAAEVAEATSPAPAATTKAA